VRWQRWSSDSFDSLLRGATNWSALGWTGLAGAPCRWPLCGVCARPFCAYGWDPRGQVHLALTNPCASMVHRAQRLNAAPRLPGSCMRSSARRIARHLQLDQRSAGSEREEECEDACSVDL
jgi:hypothetical protein